MHRRLSFVALFALLLSLLPLPGGVASAASFRTFVAQVPSSPGTGSVRIWMNSDTALGETAALETLINGSYVKRLGTFNSGSYPGANWYVDIPGQAAGSTVQYQLFTRNQSGSDYGFSGFIYSYTTSGLACAGASVGDNNVFYSGLSHDSFSPAYRSPTGPVSAAQGTVTLRLRSCQNDLQAVKARVWNDRVNVETIYDMTLDSSVTDPTLGPISYWKLDLPIPSDPTALYYSFRATDGAASGYYRDDDPKFLGGGLGQAESSQIVAYDNSYQISVYAPNFATPEWMQRGIIYQIFPDRFRDGNSANNPAAGRFSYGANVAIVRSNGGSWNSAVCDPRAAGACFGRYGDNFYGGDLQGITQKLGDGYFSSLGVTILYLNPIFRAPSNHKYDTANFLEIDPDFGTLADFQNMVAAANGRGIKIMLDGVFNHTSSDSAYFDRYGRYAGAGACEAVSSGYRSWFYFPATGNPGQDGSTTVYCADGSGNPTVTYEAWYGYSSLPKLRSGLPEVRDYFYGNSSAVGPYWTGQGASGWRFDVGADVDPGLTNDQSNTYWEGFRAAVRNPAITGRPGSTDTVMLGEEWGDATPWLLGNEWDSVMNYRFRSAALSWMFTGCTGNGCSGGTKFQENDSNDNSSSGAIAYLSPSLFNARLRSIAEDYPPNAFKAMMNLAGSHDTQRLRFLLKKINNDNDAAAVQRMKEWWIFTFSYAGNPTLYYGDEVGLSHDGVWDGSQYQDDPYNRTPFPWADASGNAYMPDTANLQAFARHMASVRQSYRALQDGDVQHGLVINDAQQLYGFARTNGSQTALVLLNRSGLSRSATFGGLNAAPYNLANGTLLLDAISGATYTVAGGSVTVSVTPTWGAVLLERSKIETPAAAALSAAGQSANVALSWPIVTGDSGGGPEVITGYTIHRGSSAGFTPGAANQIASLANPAFGGDPSYIDAGAAGGGYYYRVRGCNAAGVCADSAAIAPAKQSATLSAGPAGGTYGGSVTLTASLSAGASALAGQSVSFTLNGASAGSATTDAGGVATLSLSLGAIDAGSYPGGITASFAGSNAYNPASSSAALTIAKATATISLSPASFTYDGGGKTATATTSPAGLSGLSLTYDGAADAPVNAGSYAVLASLSNPNYTAADATGTLTIAKAAAALTLSGLSAIYDGQPKPVGVSSSPAGLSGVGISYAGSASAPADAGSYAVAVTLTNPNYTGSASGTLVIAKAPATLSLSNLTQGYDGGAKSATVTTSPAGLSGVSVTYDGSATAPSGVGTYTLAATLDNPNYAADDVGGTFAIVAASQTISFAPLADKTYGDAPFSVSATASSGLAVSFSAAGACSIAGGTVSIIGAGSCSITASQAGGGNYTAAPPVERTFSIAKATLAISLSGLGATYDGAPKAATASTSPVAVGGVSISYNGSASAPMAAGSYVVVASLDSPNYQADDVSATLTIAKATATISLSGTSATYDGGAKSVTASSSPAGLAGLTVTYNGLSAAPVNAGSYAVIASLDNPNYSAADVDSTLTIAQASATVTLADATVTYDGTVRTLAASTAPGGLALIYSYGGTPLNAGSYSVQATVDDPNYVGSASATLTIEKAAATISLGGLSATYDGGAKIVAASTSPAGLSGLSVTYNGSPDAPINAGSYAVLASLSNPNYQAAPASGTLVIAKASQSITLSGVPASITAGGGFTVGATASSGLAVSLSVSGPCSISGATVTTTGAGSCTVAASQGGSANYNAAPAVSQSVGVSPAPTAYSFAGFFAPVDNPPMLNVVKAGSAIPVKFSLGGNFGLAIFQSGYPAVASLPCPVSAPSDAIETTVNATANSLSYDSSTGQYNYIWKTDKSFAGSCRQLVLKFTDGTTQTATFKFNK